MTNKLFVAGLPFTSTEDELKSHFSPAGVITSAVIIKDRMTDRSKGFGFVEFATPEEASKAIEMFNDSDMGGRKLIVAVAKPMENRERSGGGGYDRNRSGGGFGGGRRSPSRGYDRGNGRDGGGGYRGGR